MEPVTHALVSIALGRAGLNKITPAATPMLLVSGLAADADWVTRFSGATAFLRGHRTATHSLAGSVVIVAAVAAAAWWVGRKNLKFAVGWIPAAAICAVGAGAHLLLDLLNSYGVKLLWPFSAKWYAWDLVYPVDSWMLFFLLAGLFVPELFRLVHEEIGAKPKWRGRQRGAVIGLACVALLIGGRALAHQRAVALLDSREYRGQSPLLAGAFPRPSNPLVWFGVVETDNAVFLLDVPLVPGLRFDPESADAHFKPQPSPTLKNAVESPAAAAFLSFARFPLASVQPKGEGFQVRLQDMRFASEPAGHRGIVAVIQENAESVVVSNEIKFDSAAND